MEIKKLKTDLHLLIDKVHDAALLEAFFEAMFARIEHPTNSSHDELNDIQRKRLVESIGQADSGNTISHEQMKDEVRKWFTK